MLWLLAGVLAFIVGHTSCCIWIIGFTGVFFVESMLCGYF